MSGALSLRQLAPPTVASRWSAAVLGQLLLLAAAAGFVLALLGPFGGYSSMTLAERFRFWETLLLLASIFHIAALWLSLRFTDRWQIPELLAVLPASLLAALPTALIIPGLNVTIFGTVGAERPWALLEYVLTVSLPMQMLSLLVLRRNAAVRPQAGSPASPGVEDRPAETAPPPAEPIASALPPPEPALFARLPLRLGKELQCLEMQDHYVKVHTRLGSAMLLLRMGDAVEEAAGIEGVRVHRSWWVAQQAVAKVERVEGRTVLRLHNGLQVPVSRERWATLRVEPWIAELLK